MRVDSIRFVVTAFVVVLKATSGVYASVGDFTHEWAVQVEGGEEQARIIAEEQNYDIVDQVRRVYKCCLFVRRSRKVCLFSTLLLQYCTFVGISLLEAAAKATTRL